MNFNSVIYLMAAACAVARQSQAADAGWIARNPTGNRYEQVPLRLGLPMPAGDFAVTADGQNVPFQVEKTTGRVEVTSDSGKAGVVEPLPGSTAATGASSRRSQPSGSERRGVVVPLLHTDAVRGTNRTIVTVRTASGNFSFQPVDLAGGPILVPELGFFVADVATRTTAREFCAQLQAKGLQTIRQQARQQPEQS